LFCPLDGGDCYVDTAVVTQSLARLRETEPEDVFSRFNSLGGTKSAEAEPPSEIIMICLDTSKSMDENVDFPDMNRLASMDGDDSDDTTEIPESGTTWSSQEARGMPVLYFANSEHLSNCNYFQDILGIINLAGPVRNRRLVAADVLEELATTYRKTALPLVEANSHWVLNSMELLEFIDAMKKSQVKSSLVEYLVRDSANQTTIIKAGLTPGHNVRTMGGTIPRVNLMPKYTDRTGVCLPDHWEFVQRFAPDCFIFH
jgi:hypothetical protein